MQGKHVVVEYRQVCDNPDSLILQCSDMEVHSSKEGRQMQRQAKRWNRNRATNHTFRLVGRAE
jgi:hypothetical protein